MTANWVDTTLGDVARIASGATPKTGIAEYWDGGVPWATPKDLSELDGKHEISATLRTISDAGLKSCAVSLLPTGSVLLSSRAPIGHVAINTVPMATNQGFKSLVPDRDRVDSKFLYWWLRRNRPMLESLGNGATFKEISKKTTADVSISLPPIEEQRRIAAVLDAADALRTKRREALAKLDTLSQSVLADALAGVGSLVHLGDHITFLTSGARGWAKYYADTGSRFVRSLDVQMNAIGKDDVVFVQAPDSAEARRIRVQGGDVLLTITGSRIGRAAEAPPGLAGSYVSQHVAIIRVNDSALLPGYLSMWLAHPTLGQRQIASRQYGQTKPGLNFEQIKSFEIPLPTIGEQRQVLTRIDSVRAVSCDSIHSAAKLDSLFASLQQRAFRGQL